MPRFNDGTVGYLTTLYTLGALTPRPKADNVLKLLAAWTMLMAVVRGNPVERAGFYKTRRWQRPRKLQLRQHPLCKFCLEPGIVTAANAVDHVTPHRGDWNAFVTGELQSLCEPCDKSTKRQIELRGYVLTSDTTAFQPILVSRSIGPVDPRVCAMRRR